MQKVARRTGVPDLVRFGLGLRLRVGKSLCARRQDVSLNDGTVRRADGYRRTAEVTIVGNVT